MSLVSFGDLKFLFEEKGVYLSSRELAKHFGRSHNDVLRAIRAQGKFSPGEWFLESAYLDKNNRKRTEIKLTKDGFLAVGMGFTGEKGAKLRVKLIQAFNKLLEEHKKSLIKLRKAERANASRLAGSYKTTISHAGVVHTEEELIDNQLSNATYMWDTISSVPDNRRDILMQEYRRKFDDDI